MLHQSLWRAWSVQKRAVPIIPALYFSPDGLALGAGTILIPALGPRRLANVQGEEARLLALLSATYGKAISSSVLGNIERAAKSWREGDDALAAVHLAHAALPRSDDPDEAARRLFITDVFIKRQIDAAGNRAVQWYFSEPGTAQFAAEVFYYSDEGREKIEIVVLPWRGKNR